jgi:modulator of FtsH protease HflK
MSKQPPPPKPLDIEDLFKGARLRAPALLSFGLIGLITLGKSFYTVPAESEAVVLRFGRFHDKQDAGLRFKVPFVDQVTVLPTKRQLKQEFGFRAEEGSSSFFGRRGGYESVEHTAERNMVTGDLNSASVEWVVQYRITDAKQYLFDVRDPDETLHDLSESAMRDVVGDRTVDEVITVGRQEIESEVLLRLQERCNEYGLGLTIDQVQLKNVNPPEPVQPSFNEVNQAQQEREKAINEANGEYNRAVPRARGEADQRIQAAQGYLDKRVNEAEGDVARFVALLAEYSKAPAITRARIFFETMVEVLPRVRGKTVVDTRLKGLLPHLDLTPNADRGAPRAP